jgi:S-adenosylmethionine-diacylglycerol 3-amino-3-carboxypropyl transferase
MTQTLKSTIHARPVFQKLIFAQCWEDPELDIEGLAPTRSDRVLVVTSGGCTALSILTRGPRELIAIDMNPAQSYLLELKLAGIRILDDHDAYLKLLGVRFVEDKAPEGPPPAELYRRVRPLLSPDAQEFWDAHADWIQKGVLWCGRYESYLALFRRLLHIVVGRKTVRELLRLAPAEQARFYRERWDTAGWRLLFRMFFSRYVLGRRGLDPMFFRHVEGVPSFGEHWRQAAEHVLTELPVRTNYFLAQIGTGAYLNREHVPRYLHPCTFDELKRHADRVRIVTGELESFLSQRRGNSIDKFALSNVFEWVDQDSYEQILRQVWRVGSHGARLCYRNLLVYRERPRSLAPVLRSHCSDAQDLLFGDRSFVYSNFVIEEVVKETLAAGDVAAPQRTSAAFGAH